MAQHYTWGLFQIATLSTKAPKLKKVTLNRPQQEYLFIIQELKQGKMSPCSTTTENVYNG